LTRWWARTCWAIS